MVEGNAAPGAPTYGIDSAIPDQHALADPPADRSRDLIDPEYPMADGFTPALRYRSWRGDSGGRAVRQIVIHITCGQPDHTRTVKFFQNPTSDGQPKWVSAHYVVGQGGQIVQMVRHDDVAYHASSANDHTIGIEHCARPAGEWGHDDPGFPPTDDQYRASASLVRWLCDTYGLPLDRAHIVGHAEADPHTTHSNCPNGSWDWDYFMDLVWQDPQG